MNSTLTLIAILLSLQQANSARSDESGPEKTIRSFVDSFYNAELGKAADLVYNFERDPRLKAIEIDMKAAKPRAQDRVQILSVSATESGDRASALVKLIAPGKNKPVTVEETVKLRKSGGTWKIVPMTHDEMMGLMRPANRQKRPPALVITMISSTLVEYAILLTVEEEKRRASCTGNVKQLAQALMMLVHDNNNTFALSSSSYTSPLSVRYIRRDDTFRCPLDRSGNASYSLNSYIEGLSLAKIPYPAKTVALYEGFSRVLDYRHSGKATVAFADGHVEEVTASQAKKLRWKP